MPFDLMVPTTPACTWWNRPEEDNSSGKLESTHPSRTSVKSDQVFFGVESVMRVNADSLLIRAAATSTSGTLNDLTTDLIMTNNNNNIVLPHTDTNPKNISLTTPQSITASRLDPLVYSPKCYNQILRLQFSRSGARTRNCQVVDAVSENSFNSTDTHPICMYRKRVSILTVTE